MEEFERLYRENTPFIRYYILNMCANVQTAEDIVQETFYKTLLYIQRYGKVKINRQWLVKTAHNTFIDYYRKQGEIKSLSLEVLQEIESLSKYIPFTGISHEHRMIIHKIIGELPASYRTMILLKEHYGYKVDEIASILGCSQSNVKVSLHRARKHFKKEYDQYGK